jgi:hypothetical protein
VQLELFPGRARPVVVPPTSSLQQESSAA